MTAYIAVQVLRCLDGRGGEKVAPPGPGIDRGCVTIGRRRTDPMRVAALYDIHGNLPALEAVLAGVRAAGVDRILVGGDVLPGPMPTESLARLSDLALPVDWIHGNGERETLAIRRGEP